MFVHRYQFNGINSLQICLTPAKLSPKADSVTARVMRQREFFGEGQAQSALFC